MESPRTTQSALAFHLFRLFHSRALAQEGPRTRPVSLSESEIDTFAAVYPQLTRAEIIMTIVRFGPSRPVVDDAMRYKASQASRTVSAT